MKVKTSVEIKFTNAHVGWAGLEFSDSEDNTVMVKMQDDDYISLADALTVKADRIRKERAEEVAEAQRAEEAKEKENDEPGL
jgi:hypothetical protein|tara:strand:- start:325 stop:570 length:246 start_codon:yes stop_codon:yes gene_type:complete